MANRYHAGRLRRGSYLLVLGVVVAAVGLSVGPEFVAGIRLAFFGYLLILGGIGYVGAAFVPTLVASIGDDGDSWEDLTFSRQLVVLFVIAILVVVIVLGFVSLAAPL